jgi:hypothetical protein
VSAKQNLYHERNLSPIYTNSAYFTVVKKLI